jgi:hypothetical protein
MADSDALIGQTVSHYHIQRSWAGEAWACFPKQKTHACADLLPSSSCPPKWHLGSRSSHRVE